MSTTRIAMKSASGLVLLGFLTCGAGTGRAQNSNSAEIRGTVTDAAEAVIPGVNVTILNTDTGVKRELVTNDAGIFDAVSILPGNYSLIFSKEGFGKLRRDGILLRYGVITVDAQLLVGNTFQQIEVNAQVTALQTETGEQSATLGSGMIRELPTVGRDWVNLLRVLPGVTGSGAGVSFNGTQRYQGNWLADGGAITIPHSQNVETGVIESVDEVKVTTATFDAQYGTGTAVINRLTKSGTNQFHGALYEFAQNDALNARSFFAPRVANLRRHQFGGAVGGPILKDKMFFYYNLDRTTQVSANPGFYTFPTGAMKAGDFSDSVFPQIYDPSSLAEANGLLQRTPFPSNKIPLNRMDPVALKIQEYFPATNLPGVFNNYNQLLRATSYAWNNVGRLDYNISSASRLTGTVRLRDSKSFTPSPTCPMDCYNGSGYVLQTQITDVWTVKPTVVNEFRVAFLRQTNWFLSPNIGQGFPDKIGLKYGIGDIFPDVYIGGPVGATSITGGLRAVLCVNSMGPSDVVTMIRGRHILKFGGEFNIHQDNMDSWGSLKSAQFTFSSVFTARAPFDAKSGLGYADFLTGKAASWSALNKPTHGARNKVGQMFFQDDIKLRPNLTVNLGLRYRIQPGWYEVANRIGLFDPNLLNPATKTPGAVWFAGADGRNRIQQTVADVFLPRAGFAWNLARKWAVRGGFGTFDQLWGTDTYANWGRNVGYSTSGSMTTTDSATPVLTLSDANPRLNLFVPGPGDRRPESLNGQALNYYPYATPVARIQQWSFGIQRELPRHLLGEVTYIGNYAYNLSNPRDINQVPENRLGPGDAQGRRPYPQFQGILGDLFDGTSNYNALQVSLRRQLSTGVAFDINYTWSKNLVDQDASGWGGQQGAATWQRAYAPKSNYGLSNNHIPQMFKGNVVYELPIGKGKALLNRGGILNAVLGGWRSSAVFFVHAGTMFTPIMGTQNLSGSLAGTWYPNRVASGEVSNPTLEHWFDTSAFMQPAPFTFGNSGRNILRGPMMSQIDYSMAKNFAIPPLGEAARIQLRIDSTNVINHASFGNPNVAIGTPGAGRISSTTVGGRTVELGVRLSF